jgi:hypothetical protein
LIALVGGVDGIVQTQANADALYFARIVGLPLDGECAAQVHATALKAYRWQYIVSGVTEPRFQKVLGELIDAAQMQRIQQALAPLMSAMPRTAPHAAAVHEEPVI